MPNLLTDDDQINIYYYLGRDFRFRQSDSDLQMAINTVQQTDAYALKVQNILAVLTGTIDSELLNAHPHLKASRVDGIGTNPLEIGALRSEGRRYVTRLSSLLGIQVRRDVFGDGGSVSSPARRG
jgi:hypothetical protein